MKAVLASLKPFYYYLVGEGIKGVEVRKTCPKADDWSKDTYFYMSRDEKSFAKIPKEFQEKYRKHFGKVGLRFVCGNIGEIGWCRTPDHPMWEDRYDEETCLTDRETYEYSKGGTFYHWHITDLVIYDKPRELRSFYKYRTAEELEADVAVAVLTCGIHGSPYTIKKPPQSWCYVEE